MFGFVRPAREQLKEADKQIFDGYYCGVCKSMGERYTPLLRMTLSYDCTFLAILLSQAAGIQPELINFRCVCRPRKKVQSQIVDYCADMNILLTYYKLQDDINDDNSTKAKLAATAIKSAFLIAKENNTTVDAAIRANLDYLNALEQDRCSNPDLVADAFGRILEAVGGYGSAMDKGIMGICYALGKYIYLIDAFEDYEKDIKSESYNVFYEQYGKVDNLKDQVSFLFECILSELIRQYKTMNINSEIIDNIFYLGIIQPLLRQENKENA